ncbi:hypothetical protein HUU05_23515 [candidate division KSB1 bacterium]|nr:hypothetical protein [candidate division KSB1 bacterium]
MLNFIFFALFTHLAVGALLTVLLISLEEIGVTFFRFMSWLVAVLLGLALLAQPLYKQLPDALFILPQGSNLLAFGLLLLELAVLILGSFLVKRVGKSYLFFAFGLGLIVLVLISYFYPIAEGMSQAAFGLRALSFVGSALMLGSVLGAMITGHWYLVNHKLSIQPLRLASLLFLGATLMRVLFVIALMSYSTFSSEQVLAENARTLLHFSGKGILFWARCAIGLIGPLIFAFMIYETVKLRSTQSATGMLYATVVLVFIGEAFSKFLWFFTGIPV